jgi:hypothetical protein
MRINTRLANFGMTQGSSRILQVLWISVILNIFSMKDVLLERATRTQMIQHLKPGELKFHTLFFATFSLDMGWSTKVPIWFFMNV